MNVYKVSFLKIIINIVLGIALSIFIAFIANLWFESLYSIVIGFIVFIIAMWLMVLNNIMEVRIENDTLIVKNRKGVREFYLPDYSIHAKIDNGSASLTLTDIHGKIDHIDCELLGASQFEKLLNDMGVIGDKAVPVKLKTKIDNK